MYSKTIIFLFAAVLVCVVQGANLRSRRQSEREGESPPVNNESNNVNVVATNTGDETGEGGGEETPDEDQEGFYFSFPRLPTMSDISTRFREMQDLLRNIQGRIENITHDFPENFRNRTEEIIEIAGKRYKMIRTLARRENDGVSSFISATSLVPADRRRKREIAELSELLGLRQKRSDEDTSESSEEERRQAQPPQLSAQPSAPQEPPQ